MIGFAVNVSFFKKNSKSFFSIKEANLSARILHLPTKSEPNNQSKGYAFICSPFFLNNSEQEQASPRLKIKSYRWILDIEIPIKWILILIIFSIDKNIYLFKQSFKNNFSKCFYKLLKHSGHWQLFQGVHILSLQNYRSLCLLAEARHQMFIIQNAKKPLNNKRLLKWWTGRD